ncbi:S-adenosyl-L-methionine dependent methyltransferase [Mycena alexandri]|uniref:S-adenosyl-L-methionine dependent methyltransferase n=1 Tax=Mycena alexandri TaxID=1745969 RepID=A0AAD6X0E9_9AGAR|nr:S-adenosyl-L-methionine dependent methyltransferase [Mycena alexandri]
MHPRNPYLIPPDFRELAEAYPPLQACLISHSGGFSIDFKSEVSQRRLTEALLHRDFGISLDLPLNRLCPPVSSINEPLPKCKIRMHIKVPNRLNYILWIEDLLRATNFIGSNPIQGLDIGTGASAIYPLLSCKLNPTWAFVATDVDELSLTTARSNVERNGLAERIRVFQTAPEALIFAPLHEDPMSKSDFTMCNPPFYSSHEDVTASADAKEFEPNAVCTGADVEMITPGGESSFVCRMVDESVELGERCGWYTSMLGKMSSLTQVIGVIRGHSIENYGVTEFVQGSTRRWAVVWSFSDFRLSDAVARIANPQLQNLMPPRNTLRQRFPAQEIESATETLSTVLALVDGLRVEKAETSRPPRFIIYATKNTWSRAARRKNKQNAQEPAPAEVMSAPNLVCSLEWVIQSASQETFWECQWIKGRDRPLFEGFASHIFRKISETTEHH